MQHYLDAPVISCSDKREALSVTRSLFACSQLCVSSVFALYQSSCPLYLFVFIYTFSFSPCTPDLSHFSSAPPSQTSLTPHISQLCFLSMCPLTFQLSVGIVGKTPEEELFVIGLKFKNK